MNTSLKRRKPEANRYKLEAELIKFETKGERIGAAFVKHHNKVEPTVKAQKAALLWYGRRCLKAKREALFIKSQIANLDYMKRRGL